MKNKNRGHHKRYKNENQNIVSNYNCYGCGEISHVRKYYPNAKKGEEKKGKKFFKKKNWKKNDSSSSSSSSDLDEEENLCLMVDNEFSWSQASVYSDNEYKKFNFFS